MKLANLISLMTNYVIEIKKENWKKRVATSTLQKHSVRSEDPRYISKNLKHKVWLRDEGRCIKCGSKHKLQYDHHKPVRLGDSANLKKISGLYVPVAIQDKR